MPQPAQAEYDPYAATGILPPSTADWYWKPKAAIAAQPATAPQANQQPQAAPTVPTSQFYIAPSSQPGAPPQQQPDPYAIAGIPPLAPAVQATPVQQTPAQPTPDFDPYKATGIAPPPQAVQAPQPQAANTPQQPQRSQSDTMLHKLGVGTRDAIQGIGALPSMVYDAAALPQNLLNAGVKAATGKDLGLATGTGAQELSKALDAVGLPNAETPSERVSSAVIQGAGSVIPTMGAGALMEAANAGPEISTLGRALQTAPGTQVTMAATGGAARQGAQEAGATPGWQTAAGLAGTLLGLPIAGGASLLSNLPATAKALIDPLTQSGQNNIVANALLRSSSNPATLPSRLASGLADTDARLPGAPATTAQVANDPSLMATENGLRSDAASSPTFGNLDSQRNSVREEFIRSMLSDPTSTAANRGQSISDALAGSPGNMGAQDAQNALVRALYAKASPEADAAAAAPQASAAPATPPSFAEQPRKSWWDFQTPATPAQAPTNGIAAQPLLDSLAKSQSTYFGPGSGGMPQELQAVAKDIQAQPQGMVTPEFLQNVYSRLGEIAGQASMQGNRRLAAAAGDLRTAADSMAGTPELDAARDARQAMGQDFGRNAEGANATAQILNTDKFGNPIMQPDAIANRAIKDSASARQVLNSAYNGVAAAQKAGLPDATVQQLQGQAQTLHQAMRDQFISNLYDATKTTGTIAGLTASGEFGRTAQMSAGGFARFWGKNEAVANELFRPSELQKLKQLASDFSDTTTSAATGKAPGSDTARNLSVANLIAKATGGGVNPASGVAQAAVKGLGRMAAGAAGAAVGGHDVGFIGGFYGAGEVGKALYAQPEAAMKALYTQAMADPEFAKTLLSKATPTKIEAATAYMKSPTMGQRLTRTMARIAAQSANALALPGQSGPLASQR